MVDSQPGTVTTFDPDLDLDGFAAGTRDRFMFNENQLVLAKIQQPQAVSAVAANVNGSYNITVFDDFRNLDGDLAYIDNLFYDLSTPGVPTLDVHRISIGFELQVSTDTIKIWSTGFINTSLLFAQYSFDNVTWFNVGTITWTQEFDDTIEVFPGESPPTGEFVYTGIISSGSIIARYWRLRSDAETNLVSGTTTLTVGSTTSFPSSGSLLVVESDDSVRGTGAYTGKSATTFTGYSGTAPQAGDKLVNIGDPFGNGVTELHVVQTLSPVLQHWNSDGSQAVTNAVEGTKYLDMAYDKNDDVYYAIRFDDALITTNPVDPDDDFNGDTGTSFDSIRWIESESSPYFLRSTASGTLNMSSSGGPGLLTGNYGMEGNFTADIDLVGAFQLGTGAYFGIGAKEYDTHNQQIVSALKGPYTPGVSTAGRFVGATLSYTSTVGDAAELREFRLKPERFDFAFAGGIVQYQLTYNSSSEEYAVTASGITWPNAVPGVPYTALDSATFTIAHVTEPANGQGFTIRVSCDADPIVGTSISGINLQFQRSGTNGYVRYEDTDSPGYDTMMIGNVSSDRLVVEILGHPNSLGVNLAADNFSITGGTVVFDTPLFSVVTIAKSGELTQVTGLSDSDGYAIKYFDVIRDPSATYNDYLAPRVSIATNGAAEGSGGEIYIKVNDTLYKYLKTALPLVSVSEDGDNASVITTGEIPATGITGFSYHGYSQGGLSYVELDPDLDGVFLRTIATTTLLATSFKAKLDVDSINYPFAWNVSDLATLYYVDDEALKLYDLNETKAAFVNVTSDKQVLAAGTGETATITAQVLNVYGQPKSAKSMTFSVSAGDGAISPATGCSDVNGRDTTTYTVGSAVGTATLTVSVSDIACTP